MGDYLAPKPKSRRGGAAASVDAYRERVEPTLNERQAHVLEVFRRHPAGITAKELAAEMMMPLNCVSGRVSELRAKGLLEETGERRHGSAVLRVVLRTPVQQDMFGRVA